MAEALLHRTMEAIYVLFFRDEVAGQRFRALEESLLSEEEHAMFRRLSIGIIDPTPLTPRQLERLREILADQGASPSKGKTE